MDPATNSRQAERVVELSDLIRSGLKAVIRENQSMGKNARLVALDWAPSLGCTDNLLAVMREAPFAVAETVRDATSGEAIACQL